MGYVTQRGKNGKWWMCYANIELWAEISTFKDEDGKIYRQLGCFFLDNAHLKRCVFSKDWKLNLKGYTYHINTATKCKINKTTIWLLTYAGAKVEFYYKPYKKVFIV